MGHQESAIIFRKYLLPYTERFIADQGNFLSRHNALFTGFNHDCSGSMMLDKSHCFVLQDYTRSIELAKILTRIGIINRHWLNDINQHSPSVIHAHFLKGGIDALGLKEKLTLPLVTTLHGHDISTNEKKSLFKKSRRYFFDRVDKVITVSDFLYKHALINECPNEKLIKHYIGIDVEKFTQEKIEAETPELLFVGRLIEIKGCMYLLQAMKNLQKKHPSLKLTVVGEGELKKKLRSYSQENQLNVDFVGKETAEKIRARLARSWIFVAPSITLSSGYAEGLGMVFLEAQALKTPVVSFRSGGLTEAVEDGVTGLLCKEKDVEALTEHIDYFIENSTARITYGRHGRERVEKMFDIRKQCLLLEDIYDSVK